jgi:glycine cleavage system aminomethyltransferase T
MGLKLSGTEPAPPASKLFRGAEEVGFTCSSIFSPKLGKAVALAYVRYGHQTPGMSVEVETPAGRVAAEVLVLPIV